MTIALDDFAVGGHLGAGPDHHDVSHPELSHRYVNFLPVPQHRGGFGAQLEQLFNRL